MGAAPPDPVEAGVHDDPVQPGRDGRLTSEAARCAVGRHEGVLQRIGRLVAIPHGAQGHGPQPVAMALDELAEGLVLAADVGRQQLGVRAWPVLVTGGDVVRGGHESATSLTSTR